MCSFRRLIHYTFFIDVVMVCSTQDKVVIPRKKIIERRNFYTSSLDGKENKRMSEITRFIRKKELAATDTKSWHNDSLFFNSKSLTLKGIFLSYFVKTVFSVFISDYTIFLTGIKKNKILFQNFKNKCKNPLKKKPADYTRLFKIMDPKVQ